MARRGFDQGDLVMATLRHFRPRIVSEEGSSCGAMVVVVVVVVLDVQVLVEVATSPRFRSWSAPSASLRFRSASSVSRIPALPLGLLDLPALPRGLLLGRPLRRRSASSASLRHVSCRW